MNSRITLSCLFKPLLTLFLAAWLSRSPVSGAQFAAVEFLTKATDAPMFLANATVIDPLRVWVGLAHTSDGGATWTERVPQPKDSASFLNFPAWSQPSVFATDLQGWLSGTDAVWVTSDS